MQDQLLGLTRLAHAVQRRAGIAKLLQSVVAHSVELLRAQHGSTRLLDRTGNRLVAVCRSGEPIHLEPVEFEFGEGLLGWIVANAAPIRTAVPDADPRFAEKPGSARLGPFLGVPLLTGDTCLGVLSVIRDDEPFTEVDEQLLTLVAAICAPHLEIARLARLSNVDPLTGALNRRGLDEAYPSNEQTDPASAAAAVLMIDIDHFKRVNDRHGHILGDEVLRHVARQLSGVLRSTDAIVRWGGEEFVLVLPGVSVAAANRIAERARRAIEATPAPVAGEIQVTVSAGVAAQRDQESLADAIARADKALYAAKEAGRNRVHVAA